MKHYVKFIKRFYLPLIALALIGIIYFGVNGVKAELKNQETKSSNSENLAERPLNIVAAPDTQAQNVASPTPSPSEKETTEISQTPEVKNIAGPVSETPKTKVTMRVNAGSAAGNYPVDFKNSENAYQLLIRIAEINHFEVLAQDYGWGMFVEGIGNLIQDGRDNFWFFYINGKISEVGSSDYIVRPNDLIEWRYHEWWIY